MEIRERTFTFDSVATGKRIFVRVTEPVNLSDVVGGFADCTWHGGTQWCVPRFCRLYGAKRVCGRGA